ncbi:glycoside hydrolase family 5 protein [Planctomycetota bacterium]
MKRKSLAMMIVIFCYSLFYNVSNIKANTVSVDPSYRSIKYPSLSALRTIKNKIYDANGMEVILRGVWLADGLADERVDRYNFETIKHLKTEWNVNVIRIPILPASWIDEPDYLEKYVDKLVEWAGQVGIYIVVGWHAHGNPITGKTERPFYNPDLILAKSALTEIVSRYRDCEWVLYDTLNEPGYITWDNWRPVAEELTDAVHNINERALVLVSGVDWSYDLSGALRDPVMRNNIIYEVHTYPGKYNKVTNWRTTISYLSSHYPCMIGEWGYALEEDNPEPPLIGTTHDYAIPLTHFAADIGIGWTAFIYSSTWAPSLVDYRNNDCSIEILTEPGCVIKNVLNNKYDPADLSYCLNCFLIDRNHFKMINAPLFKYDRVKYVYNYQSADYNQLYIEIVNPSYLDHLPRYMNFRFKIGYQESNGLMVLEFREKEGIADLTELFEEDQWSRYLLLKIEDKWREKIKAHSMTINDQIILKGILYHISDIITDLINNSNNMNSTDEDYWRNKTGIFQTKTNEFSNVVDQVDQCQYN